MKQHLYVWATVALLTAGCTVKSADDIKKENNESLKKTQQTMDELTNFLYTGGQPGKITVKGIVVKKVADKTELDERISITQTGGKGKNSVSQTVIAEKNKAEMTETATPKVLEKIEDLKTYINLGCTGIPAAETAGLTEDPVNLQAENVLSLTAKKVFICQAQKLPQSFVSISADELILIDASLEVNTFVGSLSASTNKLTIEGKNTLKTTGVDTSSAVLQAPSLDLVVKSEIHGEGTLALQSNGGNCVQEAEKK